MIIFSFFANGPTIKDSVVFLSLNAKCWFLPVLEKVIGNYQSYMFLINLFLLVELKDTSLSWKIDLLHSGFKEDKENGVKYK